VQNMTQYFFQIFLGILTVPLPRGVVLGGQGNLVWGGGEILVVDRQMYIAGRAGTGQGGERGT